MTDAPDTPKPRYSRRLSDKILIAFHHACDAGDNEVAESLLAVVESLLTRRPHLPTGSERRAKETLVAAYERLWLLRHPEMEDVEDRAAMLEIAGRPTGLAHPGKCHY